MPCDLLESHHSNLRLETWRISHLWLVTDWRHGQGWTGKGDKGTHRLSMLLRAGEPNQGGTTKARSDVIDSESKTPNPDNVC